MNHLMLLPTKRTNKLFLDKFRYKIVLITKFAPMFRNKNMEEIVNKISYYKSIGKFPLYVWTGDLSDYNIGLDIAQGFLSTKSEYKVMVSSPFLTFYTDDETDFKNLTKLLKSNIKYVSIPSDNVPVLEKNTVYLKRIDFDYKVTISNRIDNNESFFKWCRDNDKIRMPERCQRHVKRGWRVGDSYFYVKDAKSLSMVQMFIGSNIQRIDRVIKINS